MTVPQKCGGGLALYMVAKMNKKRRVVALVDGYNMYHGINDTKQNHLKWLDLQKLMSNFLESNQQLESVFYFTAYADHHPDGLPRHKAYVQALKARGVFIELGEFKRRQKRCKKCGEMFQTHEEKGTDVNIATMMINAAHENLFDDLFLVSGDTDFERPISLIKESFPTKRIHIFLPPRRQNFHMLKLGNAQTTLKQKHLGRALLPKVVTRPKGASIIRPAKYDPPA